jgi:hypothetical protein
MLVFVSIIIFGLESLIPVAMQAALWIESMIPVAVQSALWIESMIPVGIRLELRPGSMILRVFTLISRLDDKCKIFFYTNSHILQRKWSS